MASANDMFQKVGRATATTLSAPGYTTGDSSVNIGSTTNWPTDTGVTFAIDVVDAAGERIAGTYNVFRGRVAGASQVDQVVYEGGDAHRSYPSGATTRVYILVSSYRDNRMADGLMISHNQDGTIKGPSVATALTGQTLPADTVTTTAIADGAVTGAKIATYRVARQNDTTNVTENTAKILTGWGWIAVGGLGTGIETVTFSSAFTTLPIVTLAYGGDHASSTTYGAGTVSLKQGFGGAIGITTTGFSAYVRSADGSNWPAGANAFYQWTAIGN